MPETPGGIRPKGPRHSEQDLSLAVRPLFAVKPLFAEYRQREDGKGASSGVGLLLHRPVGEVVKFENIMSAVDDMLRDMALQGYVLPVAQSEVVKTLMEIRRTGKVGTLLQGGMATNPNQDSSPIFEHRPNDSHQTMENDQTFAGAFLPTGIILAVWYYHQRAKKRFADELAEAILTSRARRAAWEARVWAGWEAEQTWAIEGERIRTIVVLEGLLPEAVRTDRSGPL
ncbi:hypothetical protein MBLNU13_g08026t2 [Cladosporium sp. NU13]